MNVDAINADKFDKAVRRPYPPLYVSLIFGGLANAKSAEEVTSEECVIDEAVYVGETFYYTKKYLALIEKTVIEKWSDPKHLRKVREVFKRNEDSLINATSDLHPFFAEFQNYLSALISSRIGENLIEKKVRELLASSLIEPEVESLMSDLIIPMQDNIFKQEEIDLLNTNDLIGHVSKYEYVYSRSGERRAYSLEDAEEKLSKIDRDQYLSDYDLLKKRVSASIARAKEILGDEDSSLIDFLQFIVFYRTQRTDIMHKSAYLAIPMLLETAKKFSVEYEDLLYCTSGEILSKTIPSQVMIGRRKNKFAVCLTDEDGIECITDSEAIKLAEKFSAEIGKVDTIKGRVACPGVFRGRVCIIMSPNDYKKAHNGMVLVTGMTTPNMLPVMEKAGAFVTDEGGITCHAAILSREMKKPCIIGTQIATKVLKDGDLVEVDADKGIVRKIN